MQKQRCLLWFAIAVAFAVSRSAHGSITVGQVDTFQDGTAENWLGGASPMNIDDGGPMGSGDAYLQISSGTFGGKNHLLTYNQMQWTGNYTAAGVAGIGMNLRNFGDSTLPIRITIRDSTGGRSTPGYSSTNAFMLPADGQWHTAQFFLSAADLTAVSPFGLPADPLSTVLANVEDFRLLSAAQPAIIGDFVDGQIGIDNITALPAPPVVWTGASSTSWADAGNWTGSVPGSIGSATNTDTATFNQNAARSPLAIDSGRNLKAIIYDGASVNSLTIGATGGQALLLTAGGTIQTTSTVVNAQSINAPLVLEGDYVFATGASLSSATLSFGGGISLGATSGVTTLTLEGSNVGGNTISGVLADNGSGLLAVIKSGTGTWTLASTNTFSGGTTINSGTLTTSAAGALGSGSLAINATTGGNSTLNLGSNQTVTSLSTTASSGTVTINVAPGATLLSVGPLTTSGALNFTGGGTTQVNAAPALAASSVLAIGGGTLRFNVSSGSATVGAGATATIAAGATLELAGPVSALSSGSNRVNVVNDNSADSGLVVSGAAEVVGAINGVGNTFVGAAGGLTADHIVQNALLIAGTAGSPATVTIRPSNASGNPLDLLGGEPIDMAATRPFDPIVEVGQESFGSNPTAPPRSFDSVQPVAEPSSIVALLLGVACFGAAARLARARPSISSSIVRDVVGRPS
jgi:autotransporter-associated beta strand protein